MLQTYLLVFYFHYQFLKSPNRLEMQEALTCCITLQNQISLVWIDSAYL